MKTHRLPPHPKHPFNGRPRTISGFTLAELLVTVVIVGILAAIASPSFSGLTANRRTKAVASDLYVALSKARSEALKRDANVMLSPKTAGRWQDGWQIADPANASRKILDHAAVSGVTIAGPAGVTYKPSGRIAATGSPFDITASGTSTHSCVSIDLSGRPYQSQQSASCPP